MAITKIIKKKIFNYFVQIVTHWQKHINHIIKKVDKEEKNIINKWTCGVIGLAYLPVTQKGAQAIAGSSPVMSANINVSMTGNWYTRATNCMSNGKGWVPYKCRTVDRKVLIRQLVLVRIQLDTQSLSIVQWIERVATDHKIGVRVPIERPLN